jgi:L-aminopeptidase/D-esterase-like protein
MSGDGLLPAGGAGSHRRHSIFPRGKADTRAVFAGFSAGNGNGDMTGTHWVEESSDLETAILITRCTPLPARCSVEESVVNALVSARAMTRADYMLVERSSAGPFSTRKQPVR